MSHSGGFLANMQCQSRNYVQSHVERDRIQLEHLPLLIVVIQDVGKCKNLFYNGRDLADKVGRVESRVKNTATLLPLFAVHENQIWTSSHWIEDLRQAVSAASVVELPEKPYLESSGP